MFIVLDLLYFSLFQTLVVYGVLVKKAILGLDAVMVRIKS